jgi:hypothetical protein
MKIKTTQGKIDKYERTLAYLQAINTLLREFKTVTDNIPKNPKTVYINSEVDEYDTQEFYSELEVLKRLSEEVYNKYHTPEGTHEPLQD